MPKEQTVNVLQLIPLVLATVLVTVGLAMYMSDASDFVDVVQSVIVVFGGAAAGLLLSFSPPQIVQALRVALIRGIHGTHSPRQMIRAMLKVCEISRRDGLLGVADIRSNCGEVEEVCQLIGDASESPAIQSALVRRLDAERVYHQMCSDVFMFAAIYAALFGLLGTMLRFANTPAEALSGGTYLPFVCGASLALVMTIIIARLRAAHLRELVVVDLAFRGAAIILEDNNTQRLNARLAALVPGGLRY